MTPFCNAKCWVKWGAPFPLQMRCLTPVALRLPAEIAKYLKGATVDTVMGPLSWDQKGDLKGFEFGVFTWHANGTTRNAGLNGGRLSHCKCVV
ncbi:Leu/Ile/Val/Thr-binding protein [Klebsiella pneumoniae]|nr:Leu/Ile/Val/Thr-binding protein [Klebsiella pneumoniae]